MPKDDRGAAVRPEDELARRVHRYQDALIAVVRMRPEEERTSPITDAEHLLARQVAEAVTAYERGLRRPPLPHARVQEPEARPQPRRPRSAPVRAKRVRRKARRRAAPQGTQGSGTTEG